MAAHGGDAEPTGLIRSVSRALRIIERVAASPRPVPVKVIARQCELNLATAYHLVRTLCYEGYLVRLASGGYVVGPQVAERFPVTLYKEQWLRLLDMSDDIRAFIRDNADRLKTKE